MSPTQNLPFNASPLEQEKKKKPAIKETRMAGRARERDTQKKAGSMLLQIKKAQEAGDKKQLEKLKKQFKAWKASFKKKK